MEFKVASFNRDIQRNTNCFDRELYECCHEDNFYCIKIFKTVNTKTKGVQLNNGTMDSATSFIINNHGKSLVELRFIIINETAKKIFYTCSQSDLIDFWTQYFITHHDLPEFDVDVEKLKSISEIQLIVKNKNNLDWIDENSTVSTLKGLETDNQPDAIVVNMSYTKPTIFTKKTVSDVIKQFEKPDTTLRLKGYDENGNNVVVAKNAQLAVKLDIRFNNAAELNAIPLSEFIRKSKEKINEL
jgi:hypothetical protein